MPRFMTHVALSSPTQGIQARKVGGQGDDCYGTCEVYMGCQVEESQPATGSMNWYLAEVWAGYSERGFLSFRCYWKLSVPVSLPREKAYAEETGTGTERHNKSP